MILLDMNLSPEWVEYLHGHGIAAVHWSQIGDPRASDQEIMDYATRQQWVVLTHDLDFSAILASSNARGPSVIQIRDQDILPTVHGQDLVRLLVQHGEVIGQGAIITLDKVAARVRILPIRPSD
jgi:predicted nuclease of predicted toxin-antitoxin system